MLELLAMPNLKGAVVTIAAMGTQRTIAAQITDKGGDSIRSVKGNQGRLHDETRDQFAFALRQLDVARLDPDRWSFARTQDSGHDRSDVREILVCHELEWMDASIRAERRGLASVIMVRRQTLLAAGKIRSETCYSISSIKEITAPEMLGYIRGQEPRHAAPHRSGHPQPRQTRGRQSQTPQESAQTRTARHP